MNNLFDKVMEKVKNSEEYKKSIREAEIFEHLMLYPKSKIKFRNYKVALKFLKQDINKKTVLSNYIPNDIDIALITLFKSKQFNKKIK
jgi:hypothetical protein